MIVALLMVCFGQTYSATTDERGEATLWLGMGTYVLTATAPDGFASSPQRVDVLPPGVSVILTLRAALPVRVRVLKMSGQRPDTVTYVLYACSRCLNQLGTIAEDLDSGPPIQPGEVCPLCEQRLVTECHRGIWQGGGADPVRWVEGVAVTAEH